MDIVLCVDGRFNSVDLQKRRQDGGVFREKKEIYKMKVNYL